MFRLSLDQWNGVANAIYLICIGAAAVASVAIYQLSGKISEQKDRNYSPM
jgi:hypothetical protein